ncbi:MAG TPA: ATP-binding protein [Oligoflexus sp.]|uniref:ATP-binding protein n=1 Tax=Oligoflexus sp. TaxID=1971216 RepID=UPI002D4419B3|nr:ATP-binding protein [Oligoflexus sp.]HYX37709.1 ATP-binding protein [Oligoflexus sp.]
MACLGYLALILAVLTSSLRVEARTVKEVPTLQRGQIDLRGWQGEQEILIHGEWLVLPDKLIHSSNYQSFDFPQLLRDPSAQFHQSNALYMPSSVSNVKGFHASFVLLIKNDTPRSLGIEVEGYKNESVTHIFVPELDYFFRLDQYGDPERDQPLAASLVTPSSYYNLDTVGLMGRDFYLTIGSRGVLPHNQNGLGISLMKLASSHQIDGNEIAKRIEQFVILGIYAMLMIYSLTIFFLRREDVSSLTVGLLSLFLALRYLATERLFLMLDWVHPLAPYNFIAIKLFYTYAALATVVFIYQKFNDYISRKFFKFCLAGVSFGFLDVLAGLAGTTDLSFVANVLLLLSFTLIIIPYFMFIGWKARYKGGLYASLSLLFFTIAMLHDFVVAFSGKLDPFWVGHYGMLSLAIGFALVNAKIFANTYQKSVELNETLEIKNKEITYFNKNLENLVRAKTQEITSLLDHIPQGVLSLEPGGRISRDYSRHLTDIIDESVIAGRSFKELVLDRSDLNADLKDQAWQTLMVVIGEEEINFEANLEKLPTELGYQSRNGTTWLKLTWNVDVTDSIVSKVLVTMLDVSNEKILAKETESQRQEFEIIRELVEAGARKIGQYFVSATALLRENAKILEQPESEIDHPHIQCMFINIHTIKGGARSLGLKELARAFHEVEEYYQEILRHGLDIRKDRLMKDQQMAMAVYERYQLVNTKKLNRSEDLSKVIIDRDFVESHYQILRDIVTDLDRKDKPLESIIQRIHSQKDTIIRLIFDQLPAVFDEYRPRADKIAKEVSRPKPNLDFNLESISITPQMKSMLDNCMVHLLRNALCHGIELPEERLKAGKSESGTITVKSHTQNNTLNLEIHDDGRGLAIEHLREKGVQLGLLHETAMVQDIAELIFAPGISTARMVTETSGRGVGMDAVRKFLEQQGGGIEIRLGNPKDESRRYYNFKFVITIPLPKTQTLLPKIHKIA